MTRWSTHAAIVLAVLWAAFAYRRMQAPHQPRATNLTAYGKRHPTAGTGTATFAAGCFWKLEASLRRVDGVVSTTAGYTGGTAAGDVTHSTVSTGLTGHAEAVRVTFDRARVSYEQLLDVFWSSHDPSRFRTEEGHPPRPGRSIIFCHTDQQRLVAEASRAALIASGRYGDVPTEILPAARFYAAEAEHQQHVEKNSRAACRIN